MSNKFKSLWETISKSHDEEAQEKLDEVKEEVHEMDEQLDNIEEESKPGAEKAMMNGEDEDPKAEDGDKVEKPGPSIHTTEWDDCVRDVQGKNPKANAYAVCTAQLGEQSFKSQYRHTAYAKSQVREARKEMGASFAGPIPDSLLSRQDLEGEADESEYDLAEGDGDVWSEKSDKAVRYSGGNGDMTKRDVTADNAESMWLALKRERKELTDSMSDLEARHQKASKDMESHSSSMESIKSRLAEINAKIAEVLEFLKGNV